MQLLKLLEGDLGKDPILGIYFITSIMKYSNVKTAINLKDSFLAIYQKIKSQTAPQKMTN